MVTLCVNNGAVRSFALYLQFVNEGEETTTPRREIYQRSIVVDLVKN